MIPPKQVAILKYLSKYKFLSRKQMARLGVASKNSNLNAPCRDLVDANFIGEINARNYGIGYVYYLKKKGALNLAEHEEAFNEINYVENDPKLQPSTLHHRYGAISCQIELDLSSLIHNYDVGFYHRDIERKGNIRKDHNLSKATRVSVKGKILEPDANFIVAGRLFAFEYENQTHTARSIEKLTRHCDALDIRALGKEYNYKSGDSWKLHRVLCVYEKESIMKAVMKKMLKEFNPKYTTGKWFLFKTYAEVVPDITGDFEITNVKDYFENWLTLAGERVKMLS